jgi:hypothetical protein
MAFADRGARVGAICPRGSPVAKLSCVGDLFRYSALAPRRSLVAALQAMRPDLIVPCDDRAVAHLHDLYFSSRADAALRRLIVRSLGDPAGYDAGLSRGMSLELARQEGIEVPAFRVLQSEADVRAWCGEQQLPAIMKTEGSWGGAGVALVDSADAACTAFRRMSQPLSTWRAARFVLCDRDPFPLAGWLSRARPAVVGQSFIHGSPATTMAACWQGEVLAATSATVLDTAYKFSAATVIQPVDHPDMASATTRLVRRLGLSGFCGLDFMIEHGTGKTWMIELNLRATQLGHLPLATGSTLAGAMLGRLRDEAPPSVTFPLIAYGTVAFFPQAWLSRSAASLLPMAYRDVPWKEPALIAELQRPPWEMRGPLARLTDIVLRRPDPAQRLTAALGQLGSPEPASALPPSLGKSPGPKLTLMQSVHLNPVEPRDA